MKIIIYLFISIAFGQNVKQPKGFVLLPSDYRSVQGSEVTVRHIPPVRSQDSIGLCSAFTAAAAIDAANCKALGISDCSKMSSKQKASALDLARFSRNVKEFPNKRSSYREINIGGGPLLAIENGVYRTEQIATEECAPFDEVISQKSSQTAGLQESAWVRLKSSFEEYKKLAKSCSTCEATVNAKQELENTLSEDFRVKNNFNDLKDFANDTYSQFLDKMFVSKDCVSLEKRPLKLAFTDNFEIKTFPQKSKGETSNYDAAIKKIVSVIKSDTPVVVSDFCTDEKMPEPGRDCENGHSFLIKGYRKVCNSKNVCRDMIQIHNSWGQGWQDKFPSEANGSGFVGAAGAGSSSGDTGGWVDAKTVLDRTAYSDQSLGWITNEPAIVSR